MNIFVTGATSIFSSNPWSVIWGRGHDDVVASREALPVSPEAL
jgi:hypothetical protein